MLKQIVNIKRHSQNTSSCFKPILLKYYPKYPRLPSNYYKSKHTERKRERPQLQTRCKIYHLTVKKFLLANTVVSMSTMIKYSGVLLFFEISVQKLFKKGGERDIPTDLPYCTTESDIFVIT